MVRSVTVYWTTSGGQSRTLSTDTGRLARDRWEIQQMGGRITRVQTMGSGRVPPQVYYQAPPKPVEGEPVDPEAQLTYQVLKDIPVKPKMRHRIMTTVFQQPETPRDRVQYIGKGRETVPFPTTKPDFEKRVDVDKGVPAYGDIERKLGKQVGLTTSIVSGRKVQLVKEKQRKLTEKWFEYKERKTRNPITRYYAHLLQVTNPDYMFGGKERREELVESWMYSHFRAIQPKMWWSPHKKQPGQFEHLVSTPYVKTAVEMSVLGYGASYLGGMGMGALKMTKWGGKPFLQSIGLSAKTGKPIWTLTPAKTVEYGVAGYGAYETLKEGVDIKKLTSMAMYMPFIYYGYKYGARRGMGWVERKYGLSQVKGLDRVREQALYDAMKRVDQLYLKRKAFYSLPTDPVSVVKKSDPRMVSRLIDVIERSRYIPRRHVSVGGSLSTYMQMPKGSFRRPISEAYPGGLLSWATERGGVPPVGSRGIQDIDMLVRDVTSSFLSFGDDVPRVMKQLKTIKGVHVHLTGKPGSYMGYGMSYKRPRTGYFGDPVGKVLEVGVKVKSIEQIAKERGGFEATAGYTYPYLRKPIVLSDIVAIPKKGGGAHEIRVVFPLDPVTKTPSYTGKLTLKHEAIHRLYPTWTEEQVRIATHYPMPKLEKAVSQWFETGKIPKGDKIVKVKLMSLQEQFSRMGISSLPSRTKYTGYRSFKDPFTMWDIAEHIDEPKLNAIMERFVSPQDYPIPKVTLGERIIGRLGVVEPYVVDKGGTVSYMYPKSVYPRRYTPFGLYGLYPKIKKYPSKTPFKKPYLFPPPVIFPPVKTRFERFVPKVHLDRYRKPFPPEKYVPYKYTPPGPPVVPPTSPPGKSYDFDKLVPKVWIDIPTGKKHRKRVGVLPDYGKRYRFRKFGAPTMRDILKGAGF